MTHDELLVVINKYHSEIESGSRWEPDCFIKALRAVVELHKPDEFGGKTCQAHDQCWGCGEWGRWGGCPCNDYPCSTIQAIEKELV